MDNYNKRKAFDAEQYDIMKEIRKVRKHLAKVMDKYDTNPEGNTHQRGLTVQKFQIELEHLLEQRKFEIVS